MCPAAAQWHEEERSGQAIVSSCQLMMPDAVGAAESTQAGISSVPLCVVLL